MERGMRALVGCDTSGRRGSPHPLIPPRGDPTHTAEPVQYWEHWGRQEPGQWGSWGGAALSDPCPLSVPRWLAPCGVCGVAGGRSAALGIFLEGSLRRTSGSRRSSGCCCCSGDSGSGGIGATGVTGIGVTGIGVTGIGVGGTGVAGIGVAGTGVAGIGVAGTGIAGIGVTGTGVAGIGVTGTGVTGIGVIGIGVVGIGVTVGPGLCRFCALGLLCSDVRGSGGCSGGCWRSGDRVKLPCSSTGQEYCRKGSPRKGLAYMFTGMAAETDTVLAVPAATSPVPRAPSTSRPHPASGGTP